MDIGCRNPSNGLGETTNYDNEICYPYKAKALVTRHHLNDRSKDEYQETQVIERRKL